MTRYVCLFLHVQIDACGIKVLCQFERMIKEHTDKFNKKMKEHSEHFKAKFAELLEQQKNAQFPGK